MIKSLQRVLLLASCLWSVSACVDPIDLSIRGTTDLIVVDGTLTDLAEPQVIRLNRSFADPVSGRFGTLPLTKATVAVLVDSVRVVACPETEAGSYQLPTDFRGQVGHAYQLQFTLSSGATYRSTQQVMPPVPPIDKLKVEFNPQSLKGDRFGGVRAAHDAYLDLRDPPQTRNYYRWDFSLYERQEWCRSCFQGVYAVYNILPKTYMFGSYHVSGTTPYEACFTPPFNPDGDGPQAPSGDFYYDYNCRTECWEIIRNYELNLFDDELSNGGLISRRKVAQAPFLQRQGALLRIRQASLTRDAYAYLKLLEQQSQNTGGLADTPPSALVGNVQNSANSRDNVIGFFTASSAVYRDQWLDRTDAVGPAPGLFAALNDYREPSPEPSPPYTGARPSPQILIWGGPPRVPTAVCVPSDTRTPVKPAGWRD